ncbi:hypothetical protein ABRP59_14430 [Pectobacterium punjabense]|uniref:hypothetical protein n=1 Tax=Pectobacterium punjabense TaxID=2108399 RepID=UPI0032ED1E55
MKIINIYDDSITQLGLLLNANKVVKCKNNGALTAYYILEVKYPSGVSYDHYFYPDDNILTLVGKDIIFDCIEYDQEKTITHIY